MKILKIVGIVVLVLTLIGAGLVISEIINSSKVNPQDETSQTAAGKIRVPSFIGKQYNEVVNDAYYSVQLEIQAKPMNNPSVPEGEIIEQSIPADTEMPVGSILILTVSAGVEKVEVPDVFNKTYEEAYAILTAKGFKCEKSEKYNDGTHPANTVAETTPGAGKRITLDTIVYISVWSEAETTTEAPTTEPPTVTPEPPSSQLPEPPSSQIPVSDPTSEPLPSENQAQ